MDNDIALMLMSHGHFAEEIMKSAELIIGKQDNYDTLCVHLDDQIDTLREEMLKKVNSLDTSKGLIVLTDIPGGSPMNLSGYLLDRKNVIVCSGMNLPMLLECSMNRNKTIDTIEDVLHAAYENGMTIYNSNNKKEESEEDDCIL